jgi:hypothetical protein
LPCGTTKACEKPSARADPSIDILTAKLQEATVRPFSLAPLAIRAPRPSSTGYGGSG